MKGKQREELSSTSALDLLMSLLTQKRRCTEGLNIDPLVCPQIYIHFPLKGMFPSHDRNKNFSVTE